MTVRVGAGLQPKCGGSCKSRQGWRMLIGSHPPCGEFFMPHRQIEVHDGDSNYMKREYRGVCGYLRLLVLHLDAAAASLGHLPALAVHHLAAGTIRLRHLLFRYTGHHRRCCTQQEQNGNETGQATKHTPSIEPSYAKGPERRSYAVWQNACFACLPLGKLRRTQVCADMGGRVGRVSRGRLFHVAQFGTLRTQALAMEFAETACGLCRS